MSDAGGREMSFLVEPPALPVPQLHDEELAELNAEFERLPAPKIIQWAVDNYSPHLCLAASMQDAVLIDLATGVDPSIEVVFIDTGYHFPETLETVEVVRRRYGLNLRMMTVTPHAEELWKVTPRAAARRSRWASSTRRWPARRRG